MAETAGGNAAKTVHAKLGVPGESPRQLSGPGPIKTLVDGVPFRKVHLISNYHEDLHSAFAGWLKQSASGKQALEVEVHRVELRDPTSYRDVFQIANRVFEAARHKLNAGERLCVHLSPGTPTMASVSVLLAKTRFQPTVLYQTHRGSIREEDLPFDIQLDYLPELLREPDRSLQALAANSPSEIEGFEGIVGESSAIRLAVGRARRAAIRDINVLLLGESGTGKEVFARAMHRASYRGQKDSRFDNFIAVNCAAIPRELLEGELFGVAKGAATQTEERPGAFELADGGTLFLDEVGECSLDHQAKLLRALQPRPGDSACCRWIRRVGGKSEKPFSVRIIAATNRNLLETVSNGGFRDDLYYRLATVTVELPALRERKPDLPLLAKEILIRINREFAATEPGYEDKTLTATAMKRLREHDWPGNVRELNNVLVQAAVMTFGREIGRRDIDATIAELPNTKTQGLFSRERGETFNLKRRLDEIEDCFIADALEDSGGNQSRAAKLLGISQQALSKKLRSNQNGLLE
jgi:DNA-binding NtrC family response regulator